VWEVLPALICKAGVPVEVVAGRAAGKLKTVGEVAALLGRGGRAYVETSSTIPERFQ
jgi:hypothetical protein